VLGVGMLLEFSTDRYMGGWYTTVNIECN
jgi:hypothetical protein